MLNVKSFIEGIGVIILTVALFEVVVQPILVFIHPKFADQSISIPSRAIANAPAELALEILLIMVFVLYFFVIGPIIRSFFTASS